ncbi:putative SWI/SNF-related matrix-associated actin-dependent regulator of chromatin subfamily A member 3-like 1 [Prunus yedoensis var. nudiflora]|uniref:Putative SWI/SNF-related matrix-associated actin-dependent regulator of chromatin subfamily A member 3-like 1 n=1 Tax=Prunus yedoensis var. nudiflora TaxID=2094558 RepID=A0A314ZQ32_PRUYE|nr:putative SWI/SNF-related matrix-associated actin-dependent regulator of chromatin subfamily A member 3-like 1 [Prunus yedoensis var. nudiflora]
MGLGKTLTLLSLIAFDKYGSGIVDVSMLDDNEMGEDKGLSSSCCRTTLIVCPSSVLSTWQTHLEEHTRLNWCKYYGLRTKDAEELKKYDIVLTTYGVLSSEYPSKRSPVDQIEWWRVILDEAQMIKNENAQQSEAVTKLKAKRRWAVTGTPIQNGSFDLFSLMAFLRFEPFSIKSSWQSLVQRPLADGNPKGLSRLQVLMATISLRRTKDKVQIGLPSKTVDICYVELSAEERELYDEMEGEAKSVVRNYTSADSVLRKYSHVLTSIILQLRQICTDSALCPSGLKSLHIEDVTKNPGLLKKMLKVLQDGEDLDCPICIDPPIDVCDHLLCSHFLQSLYSEKLCAHKTSQLPPLSGSCIKI